MGESGVAALLCELESRLLMSATRKSPETVAVMLADGFREVGKSGRVFSKEEIIADLVAEKKARISMTEFAAQLLSEEVALVTYRARRGGWGGVAAKLVVEEGGWAVAGCVSSGNDGGVRVLDWAFK